MESETSCITILSSTKRKREGEAAESRRKRRPVLTIMTEAVVDASALFIELSQARLFKGIYKNKSGSWSNDDLWLAIANELPRPPNALPPTKQSMLRVVSLYHESYFNDPNFPWLHDRELKRNIAIVFEDLRDRGSFQLELDDRGNIVVNAAEDGFRQCEGGGTRGSGASGGSRGRRGRGSSDSMKCKEKLDDVFRISE